MILLKSTIVKFKSVHLNRFFVESEILAMREDL